MGVPCTWWGIPSADASESTLSAPYTAGEPASPAWHCWIPLRLAASGTLLASSWDEPVPGEAARMPPRLEEDDMADLIFIAATVAFFAIGWLYVKACDRI